MKPGKSFFPLLMWVIIAGLYINVYSADQTCAMKLTACPEEYNGRAIYVPRNVNVLSSDFKVCMPSLPDEIITNSFEAPSIMFIIDNSTSMMTGGGLNMPPRDSGGVRFKVVSALLDTLYKLFPDADVGLTVFQEYLYFDARSNPNFAVFPEDYYTSYPLTGTKEVYKNQAYIPLLRLDSTIQGGTKAIDLFKEMLLTKKEPVPGRNFETTVMQYQPLFTTGAHTNINVAFDATTYAMKKAKNGPDAQFVIFLSDGEPYANGWPRPDNDYINGNGMPTTFTVFFTDPSNTAVPQNIVTMTDNIKKGTYSQSNPLSAYYSMNASYDSLLTMLINQALKPIIASLKKEPSTLKLNNKTYTEFNAADSTFLVDPIPLKDSITHMEMEINYLVKVADSTTVLRDTIVRSVFDIIKSDNHPLEPTVLLDCHDTILYNVSIKATDKDASEAGPDNGAFEITRTNPGLGDLTVYYTVQGTASKGTDYTSDNLYDSIKFVPGVSSETISITPITDAVEEGDETVVIKLLDQKGSRNIRYAITGTDSAEVVIKDLYNVSITAPDNEAAEEGPDNGIFQITRNNPELGDLTVYYTMQGTASVGTDYQSDKSYDSIKFVKGVSSATITITPITDFVEEGDETVVIKLLAQKDNRTIRYAINGTDSAEVVIKDFVENTIDIAVLLNPFSRTAPILEQLNSLPENIKKNDTFKKLQQLIDGNNTGTILAVKTTSPLVRSGTGIHGTPIFGTAVLYDALGNIVKKLEIGEVDERMGDYGAFWDGTNLNNRKVGSGVYLMRVYINGDKRTSIKVGVKE
jgi:hypothetical protein